MADIGASLDSLLSALEARDPEPFRPVARYYEPMDCVIYLQQDLPCRADRVDIFLTLLWHPREETLIGVKLKGFRFLFRRLQAILDGVQVQVPDKMFVPLIKAIELALTARLTALFEEEAGKGEAEVSALQAKRKELERRYQQARDFVHCVSVDARELMAA